MVSPYSPVLRAFKSIENRNAVLQWDSVRPKLDASKAPITRWNGVTTKHSPLAELEYTGAKPAICPEADFVIGNPPFTRMSRR